MFDIFACKITETIIWLILLLIYFQLINLNEIKCKMKR